MSYRVEVEEGEVVLRRDGSAAFVFRFTPLEAVDIASELLQRAPEAMKFRIEKAERAAELASQVAHNARMNRADMEESIKAIYRIGYHPLDVER